jgi:hypothetical protein
VNEGARRTFNAQLLTFNIQVNSERPEVSTSDGKSEREGERESESEREGNEGIRE